MRTPGEWVADNHAVYARREGKPLKCVATGMTDADAAHVVTMDLQLAEARADLAACVEALEAVLGSATEQGGLGGAYLTVSGDTYRNARALLARLEGR